MERKVNQVTEINVKGTDRECALKGVYHSNLDENGYLEEAAVEP